jgi:hypothetical protein
MLEESTTPSSTLLLVQKFPCGPLEDVYVFRTASEKGCMIRRVRTRIEVSVNSAVVPFLPLVLALPSLAHSDEESIGADIRICWVPAQTFSAKPSTKPSPAQGAVIHVHATGKLPPLINYKPNRLQSIILPAQLTTWTGDSSSSYVSSCTTGIARSEMNRLFIDV